MDTTKTTQVLEGNALEQFFSNPESIVEVQQVEENIIPIDEFFNTPEIHTSPVIPEPEKKEIIVPIQYNFYADSIKEKLEDNEWTDGEIEIENESGEVETFVLSEMTNITAEQYQQIKQAQKSLKEEDFKSKYVSVEGLDETTRKMIDLKKAGGDLTELIQMEADFVHPLNGLDLEDEQVHEYLLRQKYQSLGWKPKHIDIEIEDLKKSLTLDTEAKKVVAEVNSNFNKVVETKQAEHAEKVRQSQELQKEFRKSMSDTFKGLNLKDTLVKSLVENTSKFDEYGLTNVDKAFFEAKKNPELFSKVAFLLTDEKAYNEFQGIKIKNQVTKDAVTKILRITPKTSSTASVKKENPLEEFFQQK